MIADLGFLDKVSDELESEWSAAIRNMRATANKKAEKVFVEVVKPLLDKYNLSLEVDYLVEWTIRLENGAPLCPDTFKGTTGEYIELETALSISVPGTGNTLGCFMDF